MIEYKFKTSGKTRSEHDLLGDKDVPAEALFGVQTLRCIENFDISRNLLGDHPEFVKAFGIVKMGAILANHDLGLVSDVLHNFQSVSLQSNAFHRVIREQPHFMHSQVSKHLCPTSIVALIGFEPQMHICLHRIETLLL